MFLKVVTSQSRCDLSLDFYHQVVGAQSSQETHSQGGSQSPLAQPGREDGGAEPGHQGGDHHDEEISGQEEMETYQRYH